MLTRVPEEIRRAEKAIDFGEFFSQEPLKFQFYYGENNQAEIINTIYLGLYRTCHVKLSTTHACKACRLRL